MREARLWPVDGANHPRGDVETRGGLHCAVAGPPRGGGLQVWEHEALLLSTGGHGGHLGSRTHVTTRTAFTCRAANGSGRWFDPRLLLAECHQDLTLTAPDELTVALRGWRRRRCVNMCMNGWMFSNIVKLFEWPLVRKALHKYSPFIICSDVKGLMGRT